MTNQERIELVKRVKAERNNPTTKCRTAKGVTSQRMKVSGKRHASTRRWARAGRYHV